MSLESPPPQVCTTYFRWRTGTLQQHLALLLPALAEPRMQISSTDLNSNASFVNYVRHHRVSDPDTGVVVNVVEKSIRKIAFIGSQEARLHRRPQWLAQSTQFDHPQCYGVIETPWESLIFTSFVNGRGPRMHAITGELARGIAELEAISEQQLAQCRLAERPLLWSMDFYRPWFLLRPRFNFARCVRCLFELERSDARFAGLAAQFKALRPQMAQQARLARSSPRCISHMDYLRKNLFVNKNRLLLIDWSEVKIGRVGFDAGAYLSSLFRRSDMPRFLAAKAAFEAAYVEALDPRFDRAEALRNARYVFLLNSLWHCLRAETIEEFQAKGRMELLREKYLYLLSFRSDLGG